MESTQEATIDATQEATMAATQEASEERKRTVAVFNEEDELKVVLRTMNCCTTRYSWIIRIQARGWPYGINFMLGTT